VALRTHNLPCGLLKKRFWFRRRSVVSRCWKAMWNVFLHHVHRKKRHLRDRLNDVLSRRMALRTHNLTSDRLKKRLWWSR
jgi:hypothetical protein